MATRRSRPRPGGRRNTLGDDETVVMKQDLSDEELDQATGGYIPNSWQTIVITGVRSLGSDPVIIVVGTGT